MPLLKSTVLGLVTLAPAFKLCVPPPKRSIVPADPLKAPVLVPPPPRRSVPLCT